jgi:DNA-dependent metalloprotease WSS1
MPGSNIRTFADIGGSGASAGVNRTPSVRPATVAASSKLSANATQSSSTSFPFPVCVIPSLSDARQAEEMLKQVVREFLPILQRRNCNVQSISEMCCCNDGLDFLPTKGGGRRRKRRIMGGNIWGYNQTTFYGGRKSHTIHIRLRQDHARFFPYEDVAGTLAHELTHCEVAPHNDSFFKLMDEILDEHAALMASPLRHSGAPLPALGGAGSRLGGNNSGQSSLLTTAAAAAAAGLKVAAGHTVGGDRLFADWMTPVEAAVAAAQARQRQERLRLRGGNHCCNPRAIDLSGNDDDTAPAATKRKARPKDDDDENVQPKDNDVIDLTMTEDVDHRKRSATAGAATSTCWTCTACTYLNARPSTLACDMCATERNLYR